MQINKQIIKELLNSIDHLLTGTSESMRITFTCFNVQCFKCFNVCNIKLKREEV